MNQELLELFKYSFVDCCSKLNDHYDKKLYTIYKKQNKKKATPRTISHILFEVHILVRIQMAPSYLFIYHYYCNT